jgi:hypothetical protein
MVFVDPEDENLSYWWPALLVPKEELHIFVEAMGADVTINDLTPGKHLVCYFEDGSYSVVSEVELLPFCPSEQPYLSYLDSPSFLEDKAVMLANRYWEYGSIPETFKWLSTLPKQQKPKISGKKPKKPTATILANPSDLPTSIPVHDA